MIYRFLALLGVIVTASPLQAQQPPAQLPKEIVAAWRDAGTGSNAAGVGGGTGKESLIQGKPLSYWLQELKGTDSLAREEALAVLAGAGEAARGARSRPRKPCPLCALPATTPSSVKFASPPTRHCGRSTRPPRCRALSWRIDCEPI